MKNTKAIVFSFPDHRVTPALIFWLQDIGIARHNMIFTRAGGRDVCTAYNFGIKTALESDADTFLFCDNDVFPTEKTAAEFFAGEAYIVCARYDNGCDCSWKRADDFHAALWRTNRKALEKIGLPAFRWPTTADGALLTGCPCMAFAKRARKLGLKTAWAGAVGHQPRTKDGLRDVVLFH